MMNKRLLVTLCLVLSLCGQPIQAASYYAKKAVSSAIALGYWGILYDRTATNIITDITIWQNNDQIVQANPERYQVTNQQILDLIHAEARKKGIDPSKISVVKNCTDGIFTNPTGRNMASLFTENSYYLSIGDETTKPASDANRTNYMPHFKDEWIKPVLQHELNHIKHKDGAQRLAAPTAIPLVAHFMISRIFSIPYHMLGIYTFMRTAPFWHAIQKICLLPTTLITTNSTIDLGWPQTIRYPLDRYQEKRADLNIDDDPEVIQGMISYFQYRYDTLVKMHGNEAVDNALKNMSHPHPLERIAYLTEKLNKVLEKKKQEQENK